MQQKNDGGFAEYITKRNAAVTAPVVESPVPTPAAPTPVGGFAEYMAKRNAAVPATPPAPVVAAAGSYAEYMAKRNAPVTTKAAEPFKLQDPANYDPWRDPEKAVVSFIVDGVPKKYRIQM